MIASAERIADVWEAKLSQFFGESHSDLAWARDYAGTLFGIHFGDLDFVIISNSFLNIFN